MEVLILCIMCSTPGANEAKIRARLHFIRDGTLKQWILKNDPACNENIASGAIKAWIQFDHSFY